VVRQNEKDGIRRHRTTAFKSEVKQPGKRAHPTEDCHDRYVSNSRSLWRRHCLRSRRRGPGIDWAKIDGIFGRTDQLARGSSLGLPRLTCRLRHGVTIRPTLALGGWIAFQPDGKTWRWRWGDLVVLQTEVNPVMAKLIEGGLEVTAVHNHLLRADADILHARRRTRRSGKDGRDHP